MVILKDSIKSVIETGLVKGETTADMTSQIMMIVMVESWTHEKGEHLSWDDLTDAEFRTCVTWVAMNKNMYLNYNIRMVKEMREMFPGLSLLAARNFVRGY